MLSLFSRDINSVFDSSKKVRIKGIVFRIKKVDPSNYLDGSTALIATYETYKTGNAIAPENEKVLNKKIKDHYRDVFMASVVSPNICRKEDGEGFFVDKFFMDWDLSAKLYSAIMTFTYGKKKMKLLSLLNQS